MKAVSWKITVGRLKVLRSRTRPYFNWTFAALFLEGAEQLVPDNEDASVVLVDVDAVAAVVGAVMRGRVHELFEEAQAVDGLGVDPVLVDQADAELHRNRQRVKADEGQRQVEHEGIRRAQGRLAQRSTEVVVLAGMMIDVLHPEQAATARAVQIPVIGKVVGEEQQHPGPPDEGREREQAMFIDESKQPAGIACAQGPHAELDQAQRMLTLLSLIS